MTKTPRTDKQAWFHSGIEVIYASTARELELELAAKDAECEELRAQMDQYPPT